MRRLKDKQDATLAIARAAYDTFSEHKHHRSTVQEFEHDLEANLKAIINEIISEDWIPAEYKEKVIYEKKERHLAKAPVHDHVLEATTLYQYEKALYDYTPWFVPAVKPGLGTHAMFRFLRNSLYKETQEENMYYFLIDGHHYFPNIDHQLMINAIVRKIKDGKLRRFCFKIVDSYYRGIPLGIKIAQIYGQIYLAVFDRAAVKFFDIINDTEKMNYWTSRYITARILTAKTQDDYNDLAKGSQYLADKFRTYAEEGLKHYLRFVDGIIVRHKDKAFLHIVLEISIMILERDFHFTANKDYNIRPTYTGTLIPQLIAQFFINIFHKSLRNNKFPRVLPFAEFSLTLWSQNKKSSILNDMAKVAIKYDNIVPYGGIFYAMNEFKRAGLDKLVDGLLNLRCANYGYQYSDIMLALFCIYLCGGDHIEDITTILNKYLSTAPDTRIPSSDTIARGLKELSAMSIAYTSKAGNVYAHDPAMKLNSLMLDMALLLGLLKKGQGIDVDFDNEFIPAEKSDALYSYKKQRGYFPGVMTSGPLIIGIENRQGNSNVKFEQVEELTRMLDNIEAHGLYVSMFRADCGSFIKELVEELFLRTETFYLRASSCADRRQMYEQCKDWRHTSVNGQDMDVASFEFTEFLSDWHLRLVVQRTKMDAEQGERFLPGMEYMYRAILTSDHNSTEEQVIDKYNQRGACEKNFDVQNNDFGWAHLPFSTMEDNTVFLLFTAMLKNFYQYLLSKVSAIFPGIDMKSRLKRFVFAFIVVPAKWVRVARQWTLNIYTKSRWLHYWTIFNASYG